MYEKRDYLMMQIEQLGRVLGKILADLLGIKSAENISDSYKLVNESLISELEIDTEVLIYLSESEFRTYVSELFMNSNLLYAQLRQILFETGRLQLITKRKLKLYEKALLLYRMELDETKTFSVSLQTEINTLQLLIEELRKEL